MARCSVGESGLRILFVTPYVPTPVRRRPYELIRALHGRGHDLVLVCPWEREEERDTLCELAEMGVETRTHRVSRPRRAVNLAWALLQGWPLQAAYDRLPVLHSEIDGLMSRPGVLDVAHVEHLRGVQYALQIGDRLPVLWDAVDCISRLFEQARERAVARRTRALAALELPRTRRFERSALDALRRVTVTSREDAAALHALARSGAKSGQRNPRIDVVPNGVDIQSFRPPADGQRERATVLMTGKMSYHANVAGAHYLVDKVMPEVWREVPDARVVLAGAAPPDSLRQLESRYDGRVRVLGVVPDLRPLIQSATVAVAPMPYAVGIQNKILEAMACATPVVASSAVVSSLGARAEKEILTGGSEAELATQIARLMVSPSEAAELGNAGRRYVERCHRWDEAAATFEAVYQDLRGGAPR